MTKMLSTPRAIVAAATGVLLLIAPLSADADEKFAGQWRKNLEDTKALQGLWEEDATIWVEGEAITVEQTAQMPEGEKTVKFTYRPAEDPYSVPGLLGDRDITMRWRGKDVVVKFKHDVRGVPAETTETWKLTKGGKRIEVKFQTRTQMGNALQKHVYDRVQ